jgi:short-subunit dehydrogenase
MLCTFQILPHMRQRQSGCIINIASRAATVSSPFCVAYDAGKAALTRATQSIQTEIDMDGLGDTMQLYALHPGGVLTAMGAGTRLLKLTDCR